MAQLSQICACRLQIKLAGSRFKGAKHQALLAGNLSYEAYLRIWRRDRNICWLMAGSLFAAAVGLLGASARRVLVSG